MRDTLDTRSETYAPTLEILGDRWTLMIVWASLNGMTRFDDYQRQLGIARNILSMRLQRLVQVDVLAKHPVHEGARRMEYRITPKGEALRPALEHIEEWGNNWGTIPG